VRDIADLYKETPVDRVISTNLPDGFYGYGVYIALHKSLLSFIAEGAQGFGVYLLDLEGEAEAVAVTSRGSFDDEFIYAHLSISDDYFIWTEITPTGTEMYAVPLQNGAPSSVRFQFGLQQRAGDWGVLQRNLVAWNSTIDVTIPVGTFTVPVVGIAEFELPGATDVGDVDQDGVVSLTDAVAVLNYLFLSGWQPRLRLADADRDRRITLSDAVFLLNYLFLGGPAPGR
jgi:hypothetical protein